MNLSCCAIIFIFSVLVPSSAKSFTGYFLKEAQAAGAVCLDGSAPLYYFRSGSESTKWYVHHEGGGWCSGVTKSPSSDMDTCLDRSQTSLGSTKNDTQTMNLDYGYWSEDPKVNPLMYNWNSVYIRYCDGASFTGNNNHTDTVNGVTLHYRGHHILESVFDDLFNQRELNHATDVVISGCSAGGLAVYLNVDWWAQKLQSTGAKIVGLPDSGFFLDWEGISHWTSGIRNVFFQQNSTIGMNSKCIENKVKHDRDNAWRCILAQESSKFIETPMFAMQSRYDSIQTQNHLCNTSVVAVTDYGQKLEDAFLQNFLNDKQHGAFLDSCYHHCGAWDNIVIDGKNIGDAFKDFYLGTTEQTVYFQNKPYPCKACCSA